MSDVPPPPSSLPEHESVTPEEPGGLWHRYRSLPVPLQILIPLVVFALILGGVVWATSGSDGDNASSETTTASGDSPLEVVIKGLIVTGALTGSSSPTTEAPASTAEPTTTPITPTTPTTPLPATTEALTTSTSTSTATSTPATTAPATPVAPTSSAIAPTTPPPSASDTTEPTTEPSDTTEASTTTIEASPALPSVAEFFAQWNEASTGTDVPTISRADATELTGDYAGYYLIPLTASGSTLSPQVGLVGRATAPGSGQLDEVMLVWIPGPDEDSSALYWNCFGVLVQAVSPGTTPDEIAELTSALGQAPDTPPFTTTAQASGGGFDYRALTLPYTDKAGTLDVSAIEIS